MLKRFLLATAMTPFLVFGMPLGVYAASEHSGEHHEFSAEDKAAFTDAHIAALKAGLKLTPAQERIGLPSKPHFVTPQKPVLHEWPNGMRRQRNATSIRI